MHARSRKSYVYFRSIRETFCTRIRCSALESRYVTGFRRPSRSNVARSHIFSGLRAKVEHIFNQQNVPNSEIVHLRIYVYFQSILRIIQCMSDFRIWDLTENTHTEKMDDFWMLNILNSENCLKIQQGIDLQTRARFTDARSIYRRSNRIFMIGSLPVDL